MSDFQFTRILKHGKIASLSSAFSIENDAPFSIYVKPVVESDDADILVNCKCMCDSEASALPVPLNEWTPAAIKEISANAINLSSYDVYWGAGNPKA